MHWPVRGRTRQTLEATLFFLSTHARSRTEYRLVLRSDQRNILIFVGASGLVTATALREGSLKNTTTPCSLVVLSAPSPRR